MYRVIGTDQKEYGPITGDQLKQWITEGRVNAQTKVKPEGAADWQPMGTMPEFAPHLTVPTGPPPAPLPAATPKTSGMAITSLVLGILGLVTCGVTAIMGLVLGIVAMVKIKNSGGRLSGQGLAIAGIVLSLIFMLLGLEMLTWHPKLSAQTIHCIHNLRQLGLAVQTYSTNNHGLFPPAETWCAAIQKEAGSTNVFQCGANPNLPCGYAFNARLAGKKADGVNPQTVMIFESDAGWNASGGPELMLKSPRHEKRRFGFINTDINTRRFVVVFAGGYVETLREARLQQLRWEP